MNDQYIYTPSVRPVRLAQKVHDYRAKRPRRVASVGSQHAECAASFQASAEYAPPALAPAKSRLPLLFRCTGIIQKTFQGELRVTTLTPVSSYQTAETRAGTTCRYSRLLPSHAPVPAPPRTQRTRSTSPCSTSCIAFARRRRTTLITLTQQPRVGLAADLRVQGRRVHPAADSAHGAAEQVRRRHGAGIPNAYAANSSDHEHGEGRVV